MELFLKLFHKAASRWHPDRPMRQLLRPAIPSAELFQVESTYGPKANFKISLRELPDEGRFRVTVRAAITQTANPSCLIRQFSSGHCNPGSSLDGQGLQRPRHDENPLVVALHRTRVEKEAAVGHGVALQAPLDHLAVKKFDTRQRATTARTSAASPADERSQSASATPPSRTWV